MGVLDDANAILQVLGTFDQSPGDSKRGRYALEGRDIATKLGLNPDRINDAVSVLEDKRYVEVERYLGTAPYDFAFVELTPGGRVEGERQQEMQAAGMPNRDAHDAGDAQFGLVTMAVPADALNVLHKSSGSSPAQLARTVLGALGKEFNKRKDRRFIVTAQSSIFGEAGLDESDSQAGLDQLTDKALVEDLGGRKYKLSPGGADTVQGGNIDAILPLRMPQAEATVPSAPSGPAEPAKRDPLARLKSVSAVLEEHRGGKCLKCHEHELEVTDSYEEERDAVSRTWTCPNCNYRRRVLGIPIADWATAAQNRWYAKAAAQRAKEALIRCPTCGNETIKAKETGVKSFGTSTHVTLSCKTAECDFEEREIERAIIGTGRAQIRNAMLVAVVLAGAPLIAWATGLFKPGDVTHERPAPSTVPSPSVSVSSGASPDPWRAMIEKDTASTNVYVSCLARCEGYRRLGRPGQEDGYERCGDDNCRNGIRNAPACSRTCDQEWNAEQTNQAMRCTPEGYVVEETGEYLVALSFFSPQWGDKVSTSVTVERPDHFGKEVHPTDIMKYPESYWHWTLKKGDVLGLWTRTQGHGASGSASPACNIQGLTSEPVWKDSGGFEIHVRFLKP